ncbi:DsbC family protein [Ideonella sp. 4Y16]|uniref:Thiol:disulfide interchange protein n=1 Tax=Ideonella alba TaxID=2824118 RepID=A0A940Y932_9BURK|nr:DsbC family protein [Ideonella alba]MBQ0930430.1 DsbC family protein [Ideonella alba]MBQ0945320.1 DsbC family protein [Ideonella alba]
MTRTTPLFRSIGLSALMAVATLAQADEATIRKVLADRMPNLPPIDEVSRTPMGGLWEVRLGTDVLYTDDGGNFLIEGSLFDTKTRTDLTKARVDKLTAIDFGSLPLKDAMVQKQGSGARKLVVFADPNCGYCKRLERDLLKVKDVTIYTFLYPVLGPDSTVKTKDIWCAKDAQKTWRAWMIDGVTPPKSVGECDTTAIDRNSAMGRKFRVQGTPAIVFEDGSRSPGAMPANLIEKRLADLQKKG